MKLKSISCFIILFLICIGECTFETQQWSDGSGLLCGWTQEKQKDDFDWTIGSSSTASVRTGPSVDHTLKTNLGTLVPHQ